MKKKKNKNKKKKKRLKVRNSAALAASMRSGRPMKDRRTKRDGEQNTQDKLLNDDF